MQGEFSYAIREVFLNLLKNLWIDISPIQLINLPSNIKIWNQVGLEKSFYEQKPELNRKFEVVRQ